MAQVTVTLTVNAARDCNDANPGHAPVDPGDKLVFKNQTRSAVTLDFGSAPVSKPTLHLAAANNSTDHVMVNTDAPKGNYDYSIVGDNNKPECEPPGNKPSMVVN